MEYTIYFTEGHDQVLEADEVIWNCKENIVEFNKKDETVAIFNTDSIKGFIREKDEESHTIEAVKGIEYTGVVDLGIEPEERFRCGKCKHYVVTDSRSNWNGEPPTKIYVCDLVGHDCYFEPKEDEENG